MKFLNVIVAVLFLIFTANSVFAGDDKTAGTAGAQELRIPVGARSVAIGGSGIADVTGTEALFWNPAGLALSEQYEVAFSYLDYFADMKFTYTGLTASLGDMGNVGVSVRVFSVGDIEVTSEAAGGKTGQIISPTFITLGATYAKQMTDRVFLGTTVMYVSEQIGKENAKGVAFDFGFQYNVGLGGLKLGAVIKNIGPNMQFDGPDFENRLLLPQDDPQASNKNVKLEMAEFELPSYMQFGATYDIKINGTSRTTLSGSFRNNNFLQDEFMGGVEYAFNEMFFLRGGYIHSQQDDYIMGATFGLGMNLNLGGMNLMLDYALGQNDFFDSNQWFGVKLTF